VAVVTSAYPATHIFSAGATASTTPKLMAEFQRHVTSRLAVESISSAPGGLRRTLRPFLQELAARFDDLEALDKIEAVRRKAEKLQDTMRATLTMADERESLLASEEAKTAALRRSAQAFHHQTAVLRRRACCALTSAWIWVAVIVGIVAAVGVGIVMALNFSIFKWFGK